MAASHSSILTHRVFSTLVFILSIYGSYRFLVHGSDFKHGHFNIWETPFTGSFFVIFVYWILTYIAQAAFVVQFFFPDESGVSLGPSSSRLSVANVVGWHFSLFNVLHILWAWLFRRGHYIMAEIVLIVNLVNLFTLYMQHKTYAIKPLSSWFAIHVPTAAFPISWIMYAIFWNGAVMFHAHRGFVARILANIFIWDFLIVPLMFLAFYNDWAIGYTSALLQLAVALGQIQIKSFALQWIFALVIAIVLAVASLIASVGQMALGSKNTSRDTETAPLIN